MEKKVKMENNNVVKPVSRKDIFPSEGAETSPPAEQMNSFLFLPCSPPEAPEQTSSMDFFQKREVEVCTLSGTGALFPSAPLSPASKMVGKLSFRRAETGSVVLCRRSACSGAVVALS